MIKTYKNIDTHSVLKPYVTQPLGKTREVHQTPVLHRAFSAPLRFGINAAALAQPRTHGLLYG